MLLISAGREFHNTGPAFEKEGANNALTAVGAFMTLIDFTLSNARRFYSSMGKLLAVKGISPWRKI